MPGACPNLWPEAQGGSHRQKKIGQVSLLCHRHVCLWGLRLACIGHLVATSGWQTKVDLEGVVAVRSLAYSYFCAQALDWTTHINHWKPVNVPIMTILTGRPFHRPEKPMFL